MNKIIYNNIKNELMLEKLKRIQESAGIMQVFSEKEINEKDFVVRILDLDDPKNIELNRNNSSTYFIVIVRSIQKDIPLTLKKVSDAIMGLNLARKEMKGYGYISRDREDLVEENYLVSSIKEVAKIEKEREEIK